MKALIVDDHPVVRSGLRRLLAADPQIDICEATTAPEALSVFRACRPSLAIVDLNLPGSSGFEVIGRLKIEDPKLRILVISMHDNLLYVSRALQAGADGYVSKNAPPEEILTAIKRVAAGQSYIEHEIAQELAVWNARAPSHPVESLSARELEILRLLGEGCSLAEVADAIGVAYKTAANQLTQLKDKLGAARTADLMRIAISWRISSGAELSSPLLTASDRRGAVNPPRR